VRFWQVRYCVRGAGVAMALFKSILVTGCGGDIGQGVGKVLKSSGLAAKVIGCDLHDEHPGRFIFDGCEFAARAGAPDYFSTMLDIIGRNGTDLIVPTSEPEIRFLTAEGSLHNIGGVPVLTANRKALEIGLDKLATAEMLEAAGLDYPWTAVVKDGPPKELPCMIKMRRGSGSRGIYLVDDVKFADYLAGVRPEDIWQEYLRPDDEEYTCGLYRAKSGQTRTIIMKRRLVGGLTGFGQVVSNSQIDTLLGRIADAVELEGSINVQLRLTERGPVVFEINPRFSSTVVFRHMMGWTYLVWAVSEMAGLDPGPDVKVVPGTRFCKGYQEYILG
jgi:carbamoyl-phosphate synthase large subunit